MSQTPSQDPILKALARAESLPSIPAVALQVLSIVDRDDATLDDIADAIALDPALAGRLLRIANSSFFAPGSEVSSLKRATLVLGFKTVKLVSLGFSLVEALPSDGPGPFDYAGYWRRSVVSAVSARTFAAEACPAVADEAFLAALLSRIGQIVLGHGLPERYAEVIERAGGRWPGPELEREVLGSDGFAVGAELLRSWSLPRPVSDCIASLSPAHPPEEPDVETAGLRGAVRIALDCEALLCDPGASGEALARLFDRAVHLFELEVPRVEELLARLNETLAETAAAFEIDIGKLSVEDVLERAREALVRESLDVASENARIRRRAAMLELRIQELQEHSSRDAVTGLLDRACFDETLAACASDLAADPAAGGSLGLLLIDVDRFKRVNDTHGHQTGDAALKLVGEAVRSMIRGGDVAARYGGDEIGVVLPNISAEGLRSAAERVRSAVASARLQGEGVAEVLLTVSIGAIHLDAASGPLTAAEMLRAADRALYEAKRKGKDRCEFGAPGDLA